MTLILSNEDIEKVLEMDALVPVLEEAYIELVEGRGGNRRRSDIVTPTTLRDDGLYALKSMDGVIPKLGVGAIRLNSDILTFPTIGNEMRRVKVPAAPNNRYVGLVLLFSTHNGEPLMICPDGVMQRMRVGATNGIAAKHLALAGADTLAVLGSGWQAGAAVLAHAAVRNLSDVRVYSPNPKNRKEFALEMSEALNIDVKVCASGEEACKGAHMVACATNAVMPVFSKEWLEPGMHIGTVRPGATEVEKAAWSEIEIFVLLDHDDNAEMIYTHGVLVGEDKVGSYGVEHDDWHKSLPSLPQIINGDCEGRTDDSQCSCFLNNLGMGYQFAATGYVVYQKAKELGLGTELPTDMFTETVHP
ncbi:MAG: ornithine cyclodeaminase [Rhodospirillaceae bacterium]|jgi:ornithine cyclodeaminase/alanine dehydrogenase-like protein (mu-crystallin family)|nr:ornithine cyclodeaminase [Rhodospirillaceae bacterium]